MALEEELVGDIVLDIDITMMTSKRCNQGEPKTPNLLQLPGTKEAYNIVERYIFWNVIWKPLNKLGWILDKDGNCECEFIAISPLEPICNTMKKNMDYFDDEVQLMLALFADPRLALQNDLRDLRGKYDELVLQFTILRTQLSNNQMIFTKALSTNKGILKLLESRFALIQQVQQQRSAAREDKESSLLIQSVIARQEKDQALAKKAQLLMDESETDKARRKRLHREIIINEFERRKEINGGKFPNFPKNLPATNALQQQELAAIVNPFISGKLENKVKEVSILDAIATPCHPSEKPSIPAVVSLEQLVQQLRQQREIIQQQKLVQQQQHQQQEQIAQQNFIQQQQQQQQQQLLPSQGLVELGYHTIIPPIATNIANGPMIPMPKLPSTEGPTNPLVQNKSGPTLKLSWNEIKDAYHDLKPPTIGTTVPPSIEIPNRNFGSESALVETLASSRKRLRLF